MPVAMLSAYALLTALVELESTVKLGTLGLSLNVFIPSTV